MPALRDNAINYNATTTQTGFVIATPNYEQNDLLVTLLSTDTGTQNYTAGEAVGEAWTYWSSAYTNVTTAANNATAGDLYIANTTIVVGDCLYIGHTNKFNSVSVLVSTVGTASVGVTFAFEYYNGSSWATPTAVATGITWTAALGYRTNIFVVPTDWTTTVPGSTMANQYWVRIRITAGTLTIRQALTQAYVSFWQQLFSATNTVNHGILYKIASASEPVEYTFIYTTGETSNGMVMSFRDIDTTIPFSTTSPAAANYADTNRDSDQALGNGTTTGVSQSYAAAAGLLASCKFWLKKYNSPTGNAVAKLYTHSGSLGSTSVPTGVALATSSTYDVSLLTSSYQWIEFTFPWKYTQTATNYCLAIEYSGGDASNYVHVGYDASSAGHAGNKATYASATWTYQATHDCCFSATQFTYTTGTNATGKSAMPTMTTSRDNSLLLFNSASATAVIENILIGPCTLITGKDGATHSDSCAWGFQATAGTTPATVYRTNMGATSGQTISTSVVGINPPVAGASIIPGYCTSDASVYLSPISGTTAFNGDNAFAADITTYFGTTLNTKTLSNGSVAAIADYGLNSYHSMGRLTGVVTSGTWAGATNVFAAGNRPNVSTKNILCHMIANTPVEIQTTDSVSLIGACGIAFGLCSGTNTDYKVWHVGGAGTTWDVNRTPIVINTGNTTGKIQDTGSSFNPAAIVALGWAASGKVAAPDWDFGSAWVLDTVIVAGGNAAEPLDIPQIVKVSSTGHERMSAVQQGAKQMLLLGPLQIGDGATNPVFLDLNSTAIEFPRQYDKDRKEVYYCSTDNVAGITYYAGVGDTIMHRNSIISSPSRYHWKLHTSYSTTVNPDFSGLSVIGAGTISLARAVVITSLTINNYSTLDVSGATLNLCTIMNVPATDDSMTTNGSTVISNSSINVTTVTAGNRWCSVASPSIFTGCTFTGSASTGHAIRINSQGTYTLASNTFTGFGADGTTSAAIYNDSGGLVTLNVTGGVASPTVRNGTNATTTINNAVTVTINVKDESNNNIQNARVSIQGANTSAVKGAIADDGGVQTVQTTAANNATTNDMTLLPAVPATNDAYYFGSDEPFYRLIVNVGQNGAGVWTILWEYYNGSGWATIPDVNDGTNGFRAGTGNLNVTFSPPSSWAAYTIQNISAFWVRARVSAYTSVTTQPLGTQAWVYQQIMNELTTAGGIATESFNYTADTAIIIRIRKSSTGSTKYVPINTTGTILSTGFTLTQIMIRDSIASA
jgi:hypothetical protein